MGLRCGSMPVEFLTDDEAAAYGPYAGTPSQADLDRVEARAYPDPHVPRQRGAGRRGVS